MFREALIDAEFEEEGAVLMPQHDAGCEWRSACTQRHDLAVASRRARGSRTADEYGVALDLGQCGTARAFPAAGFECQEGFQRGCDLLRRARHLEGDCAMVGQSVALPA